MADGLGGFGQLSLFLTLAFGFPGLVYVVFIALYFPAEFGVWSQVIISFAPGETIVAGLAALGAVFFVGLTLTSVFFAMEFLLRKISVVERHLLPKVNYAHIGYLQTKGKDVSFIQHQAAQAIMHYNIWFGVLVLTAYYVVSTAPSFATISLRWLFFGIVLIAANMYVAKLLFAWTATAISDAMKGLDPDGSG